MTGVSPFDITESRFLTDWWRHLSPSRPSAIWFGSLLIHRVEALVGLPHRVAVSGLAGFALKAIAIPQSIDVAGLSSALHLGVGVVRPLVNRLARDRLIEQSSNNAWSLTPTGKKAVGDGQYEDRLEVRRTFCFAESELNPGRRHFIPLRAGTATQPWAADAQCSFDLNTLKNCLGQSSEWKHNCGFPAEVDELILLQPSPASGTNGVPWQRIVTDRLERLQTIVVSVPDARGREQVRGYGLPPREPIFDLDVDWRTALPDLLHNPDAEEWRESLRSWGRDQESIRQELDHCELEVRGIQLRITLSDAILAKLKTARPELLRGETWLQAGSSRLRRAAQLEFVGSGFRK